MASALTHYPRRIAPLNGCRQTEITRNHRAVESFELQNVVVLSTSTGRDPVCQSLGTDMCVTAGYHLRYHVHFLPLILLSRSLNPSWYNSHSFVYSFSKYISLIHALLLLPSRSLSARLSLPQYHRCPPPSLSYSFHPPFSDSIHINDLEETLLTLD